MKLFDLFKVRKESTENYFDSIIKENKDGTYVITDDLDY